MSLAFKGRERELYNESVAEPSDAVGAGAGKVITSVEELAERPVLKRRVPKDVSFGYLETLFLAASFLFRYLVAPSKTLTLLEARRVPRALPKDAHFVHAGTPSPTQREAGA
jgi:hypothetical protein